MVDIDYEVTRFTQETPHFQAFPLGVESSVCVCLCLCFQLFTGLDVQEWMPALANGSFEDPRLNLITGPSEPRACYAHSFYMTIYGLDICTPIAREILLIDGW